MSSNPLMMGYGGGDLYYCCWLPMAGDRATARSLCVQAVGGGLSGLAAQFSDESALELCIHVMRYTIDVFTFFTFFFYSGLPVLYFFWILRSAFRSHRASYGDQSGLKTRVSGQGSAFWGVLTMKSNI